MEILDVFNSDAYKVTSLTDAINAQPHVPGRIGQLGLFEERGVTTTSIAVEEKSGVLSLVATSPRGGKGVQFAPQKRSARQLAIPHLQTDDTIIADEVQNVRPFGTATGQQVLEQIRNDRLLGMSQNLDATIEYHKLRALHGEVLDADGLSVLYNLFTVFNVVQEAEVAFDLTSTTTGQLTKKVNAFVRKMQDNLGAGAFGGVHVVCGANFWDDLCANGEILNAFRFDTKGSPSNFFEDAMVRGSFSWRGVTWEEYRGKVGAIDFVHTDKCIMFPKGVPGLYKGYFAPADYNETVGTLGLPRYAKAAIDPEFQKWIKLEAQSNPLFICTRPKVLMKGKRGA